MVDEIVVPVNSSGSEMPAGMKPAAKKAPVAAKAYHITADPGAKAKADSLVRAVNDSLARETSGYGLVLTAPYAENAQDTAQATHTEVPAADLRTEETNLLKGHGISWIFALLALLFCAVCLKFKNNPRYLRTLLSDLRDVRTRHNLFDDTVRETSYLLLLNITWICCAGVLLWRAVMLTAFNPLPWYSFSIPDRPLPGIGICIGAVAIYMLFIFCAYAVTGNVFTDSKLTRIWVKGAAASFGLQSFIFFPLALLALCYPLWTEWILLAGAVTFTLGKILFIYKGFRIFFSRMSSWLLFLYYLCSLEIVPLILTYLLALLACSRFL